MDKYNDLIDKINKISMLHNSLKNEIIEKTYEIDKQQNEINDKLKTLSIYEREYVQLVDELNKHHNE